LFAAGSALLADLAGEDAQREHRDREDHTEDESQSAFADAEDLGADLAEKEDVDGGDAEEEEDEEETIMRGVGHHVGVIREGIDDDIQMRSEELISLINSFGKGVRSLGVDGGVQIEDLGLGILNLVLGMEGVQVLDVLELLVDLAGDLVDVRGGVLLVVLVEVLVVEIADLALGDFESLEGFVLGSFVVGGDHFLVVGLDDLSVQGGQHRLLKVVCVVEEVGQTGDGEDAGRAGGSGAARRARLGF